MGGGSAAVIEEELAHVLQSIYTPETYRPYYDEGYCLSQNVTYHHRVDNPDSFNSCSVPLKGADAFLFASLALVLGSACTGKLSLVFVLIIGRHPARAPPLPRAYRSCGLGGRAPPSPSRAPPPPRCAGCLFGIANYEANLLQLSNAISLWLGIQPPDIFFYAFLPPLLVDAALRLDFYIFKKIWVHIVVVAYVMVIINAAILTPFILSALGFANRGWDWVHGAIFASMLAPTDAVAVTAMLKAGAPGRPGEACAWSGARRRRCGWAGRSRHLTGRLCCSPRFAGGGPEGMVVFMEGEALLNDASAVTLYIIFMGIMESYPPGTVLPTVTSLIPSIIKQIAT